MCGTLSSLFLLRRRAYSRQTLLYNQFHRVFHRNLRDPCVLVHPAQFVVRLGVRLHLFPHIVLRIRQMSRHPLHSRLRRKARSRITHRCRRFIRIGPIALQPLVNADRKNERRNRRNPEIGKKFENRGSPDVCRLKRHVRVLGPLTVRLPVVVMLIAHSAQAPPKDLGLPPATTAAASGSSQKIPAISRLALPAPRCLATSAPPAK